MENLLIFREFPNIINGIVKQFEQHMDDIWTFTTTTEITEIFC